jgi:hypothetical protein
MHNDLTWSQAHDLILYFRPAGSYLDVQASCGMLAIFDRTTLVTCIAASVGTWETVLRRVGCWPDDPPPPRFANMHGSEFIATASSHNMAKRIANALNWYKPAKRGT